MYKQFFQFWSKPRDPDISKSGQQSKNTVSYRSAATANTVQHLCHSYYLIQNTYAFLLRIVKGADYQQPHEVEALALYNEACTCNYISRRFARDQLQVQTTEPSDDGDCVLVWACERLGRYEQRTVFWIAPDADFDLLFGREDDCINRSESNQFDSGIESGILSKEFPRREPPKSFQGGINDEFLLPVERSNTFNSAGKSRMPSLAEIKKQLAAQLGCSPERKLKHKRRRALNVFDPRWMMSPEELLLGGIDGEMTTHTVTLESPDEDRVDETPVVQDESVDLTDDSVFKGNKRVHSGEHSAPSTDTADCPKSPKLRNVRARPLSIHATFDHKLEHVLAATLKTEESSHLPHKPTVKIARGEPLLEEIKPSVEEWKRYQYEPLPGNDNIRLLSLLPGESNEDIHCSLSVSFLSEELQQPSCEYEALSHTWGSNERSHRVLIDGLDFPVTANLSTALREIRLRSQVRTLWVDAICINQDDISERYNQVQKMAHIFRSSKNVLYWPGEGGNGTTSLQKNQVAEQDVSTVPDEILFSCMGGEYSPSCRVSHDGSSISLSSQEPGTRDECQGGASSPATTFDQVPSTKKPGKKAKRIRRAKAKVSVSKTEPSWAEKFNEFWTKDDEAGNWYHDDKLTQKRIWYDPPPLN
jgi:hypothetical protein